jgi:hypothetical protein
MRRELPGPVPVIVTCGFLGSGKTTLLRRILSDPLAVDQAGHQRPAGAINHDRLRGLDRAVGHLADSGVLDQQLMAALEFIQLGIEHLEFLEQGLVQASLLRAVRAGIIRG